DFERLAPVPFSVVCFRARPWLPPSGGSSIDGGSTIDPADGRSIDPDVLNERLLEAVNATGEIFISHTRLNGRYTLRLAIGNLRTTETHVRRAWELLHQQLSKVHRDG